jgi:hypothetical protein
MRVLRATLGRQPCVRRGLSGEARQPPFSAVYESGKLPEDVCQAYKAAGIVPCEHIPHPLSLSASASASLFLVISVCLSVSMFSVSVRLSVRLSVCLSVCLCLPIRLFLCLFVCLSSVYVSLSLSVSFSLCPFLSFLFSPGLSFPPIHLVF